MEPLHEAKQISGSVFQDYRRWRETNEDVGLAPANQAG